MTTPAQTLARPMEGARRAWLMGALVLSTVMGSLDSSFVPLTFRDLIVKLDTSTSVVVWVALGYLIAATGPMLFLARLGDRHGHSRFFRAGTLVYAIAMSACGFAPDVASLIALRAVQGLGMALFLPATFSLATRAYAPSQRGRAVGILASANALGFILGPLFAGWLLDAYDWRATFVSRIPLGVLAVALAFLVVREPGGAAAPAHAELDLRGAVLATLGFFGLLYGLNRLPVEDNHREPLVWAVFLAGLGVLALFVRHERRTPEPLVDIDLFRQNPAFTRASVAFTLLFATFPLYLFILPIVLLAGLELRAWDAGLLLGSVALITFVVSPFAGGASDRIGAERLCMVGISFVMVGYLALVGLRADIPAGFILVPMVLIGIGTGLFFSPNNALILGSVPPARAGMASGLIGTMRQAGYAVGFAITASFFTILQDSFEKAWSRTGLGALPPEVARRLAHLYESGGVWSPDMLVFVCRMGAILAAGITLAAIVYSAPRLRLAGEGHLAAIGMVALLVALGMTDTARRSELRLVSDARVLGIGRQGFSPASLEPVAPFGMASRLPRSSLRVSLAPADVFALYCAACHGADGKGVQGLGLNLTTSTFVRGLSNEKLAAFLHDGRTTGDPKNTTGKLMPGMKSFPSFTEANYQAVVQHVRKLNGGG